jgi:hypothetical protein
MVRIRRVGAERNRLDRWTTEVLADTRTGLANEFADRLVRAAAQVQAVLADLSGRVDRQVAEHDRAVRSALSRRRERAQARLEQASLERAR